MTESAGTSRRPVAAQAGKHGIRQTDGQGHPTTVREAVGPLTGAARMNLPSSRCNAGVVRAPQGFLVRTPTVARSFVLGALGAGLCGAVVGLVVGLSVHAATAWFAVLEVGLPSAVAGGLVGAVVGLAIVLARRIGAVMRRSKP